MKTQAKVCQERIAVVAAAILVAAMWAHGGAVSGGSRRLASDGSNERARFPGAAQFHFAPTINFKDGDDSSHPLCSVSCLYPVFRVRSFP